MLQVDGNERSHSESRMKAELSSADQKIRQLEEDNTMLRRRLLDVTEGKGAFEIFSSLQFNLLY